MNQQIIQRIAFIISLAGLLLLLWVNLSLVTGRPAPVELSFVSIFFVLFPIWGFTIYYLNQIKPPDEESINQMGMGRKIRYLLGNPPAWTMVALAVIYVYALYSLFLFMTGGILDPEYVNGQYQFNNHGKITVYTEAEYQIQHRLHLRSVTGFFLAFFAVSTVALAPWRREVGS